MPGRRFTPDQHAAMAAMREAGRTFGQIAQAFACSESTAYWTCLRLGAEPPRSAPPLRRADGPLVVMRNGRAVRRFTPEEDATLLRMEAEGKGYSEIGRAVGRRHNTVQARLMTLARHQAWSEAA